jgi:NADH-quinone oxidoreductase subunit A
MLEYIAIIFAFLFALGTAALLLTLPKVLSPKFPSEAKSKVFECGMEPLSSPRGQIPVHFYIIAMLFIVFDVEMVFLFPWAVNFREMGVFGLVEMGLFLAFVILGYAYAWKKGALECK